MDEIFKYHGLVVKRLTTKNDDILKYKIFQKSFGNLILKTLNFPHIKYFSLLREREGTIFYSTQQHLPAYEHTDIYLQLC